MRLSKPSPSMVVATIALVFAATGTGIAATGAITGVDIQNGSIISADLATGAVKSVDIATGGVTSADIATGGVTSADIATGAVTSPKIPGGTITSRTIENGAIGIQDIAPNVVTPYDPLLGVLKVTDAIAASRDATLAAAKAAAIPGPVGPMGSIGDLGPGAVSWNAINADIPLGSGGFQRFFGDFGSGAQTFAAAATTSPTVPTTISNGKVDLLEVPSPDAPLLIEVTLMASLGTPEVTGASCFINVGETSCTIPGPVKVPAGARLAWRVKVLDGVPSNPGWSPFKVGLAYTSTSG